jgi:hypothetical protein
VHRAVNTGTVAYEEVVMFFLESPGITPQPPPADGFDAETRNGGERDHSRSPDL